MPEARRPRTRARFIAMLVAIVIVVGIVLLSRGSTVATHLCAYTSNSVSEVAPFERLVGARIDCVIVFDTADPSWYSWTHPWFVNSQVAREDWSGWVHERPGRQLIITLALIPSSEDSEPWRAMGARGAFTFYAKQLARNLVSDGLGNAIIRLGHEANGTWYADNVGTNKAQWTLWKAFWYNTALAMKSVSGAHFTFDWCIAIGYRAIPFSDYYPGNDVVTYIGADIYDRGDPTASSAWKELDDETGGIKAITAFADAQGKPFTIPEWGVDTASAGGHGGDPGFISDIESLVRRTHAAFESYFLSGDSEAALEASPAGVSALRRMVAVTG